MRWLLALILLAVIAVALQLHFLVLALVISAGLWWLARRVAVEWAGKLEGSRHVSAAEAAVGDVVSVQLKLGNAGRWPVLWTLCEELMPQLPAGREGNWLGIDGTHAGVVRLSPGQTVVWEYHLKCRRRGYYQLGPLVAETGDVLGLERRFRMLAAPVWLLVRPEVVPLGGYDVESRRPIGEIVMTHRMFEDPSRTSGVRQYQAGDPLNRVHWRATARTGVMQSRVFEPTSVAGATLLVDFHSSVYPAQGEPVRSDLTITAAASIANLLHEMNQQFGLLSNGRDAVDRIRQEGWQGDARTRSEARASASMSAASDRLRPVHLPTGKSPDRLSAVLDQLARLELSDGTTLDQLILEDRGWLARDATVIAFLTRVEESTAFALENLRRRGLAVTVILNCHEDGEFQGAAAWLLSRGIEARHLRDRDSIPGICRAFATAGSGL